MKKNLLYIVLFVANSMLQQIASAQETESKFSLNGAARAVLFSDDLQQENLVADTITAPKENSGHTLVDLGINIRPNKNIEIQGMVRIRNDFGGFWGSGITFDERQLYVKGIIGNVVRYQLGDINYKLTPYTFFNNNTELTQINPTIFNQFEEIIKYDNFYDADNTWRQQGAATDFSLQFSKYINEIRFNLFTSRIQATAPGVNEQLFSGLNISLVQSKYATLGVNYVNLYDIAGTSNNPATFHNPVTTFTLDVEYKLKDWQLSGKSEAGQSKTYYDELNEAPSLSDYFVDGSLQLKYIPAGVFINAQYKSIGPDFRSPGAQTKRLDFNKYPRAYDRITNDQVLRPLTMLDVFRDAAIYNLQLQKDLMLFDPKYDNITPYGTATPNRQGITIGAGYNDKKEIFSATAAYSMLTEIRGQGTFNLRTFNRVEGKLSVQANKLIKDYEKLLRFEIGIMNDQTNRVGQESVAPIDLKSNIFSAGIEAETFSKLDIILGIQSVTYDGKEYMPDFNNFGEIVYFNAYLLNGSESLLGSGLRYRFSDAIFLSAMYNKFTWTDNTTELPTYTINEFAFIFQMNF